MRVVELLAPARLGTSFRWLLASSWTTNLGDGLALAAGPLLVASQTREPFLVALAALLQWLAPLLFALVSGVVTDRVDRRRLVCVVDLVRASVLGVLTLSVVTGVVSIAVVLVALFCLATAETFADNASATLLPMLVHRDDLAVGNARLQSGLITFNQLAGPSLGAVFFAAGAAWPFALQTLLVLAGALLVLKVAVPTGEEPDEPATDLASVRHDLTEGLVWVWRHDAVRTLVLTILIFNVTFGAAWSVLVLWAQQRLGLGEAGYGLLATLGAVGGLVGTGCYGWITRHVSLGDLMRIGLVVETLTHLVLALTTHVAVALVVFFFFGMHAFIWGTTSITVRQRAVPGRLQGRVGAVNLLGIYGGLVLGAGVGGALAQRFGVTAPFWFAFVGSAAFCVLIWRSLSHIAHADAEPDRHTHTQPGGPDAPLDGDEAPAQ
ncbi:MFS transporter [Nocardioides sp. CBS4Y-1]|uniref:MFS transporter n=1 Tax=Nocardioides acrostichi TaxID=2784339 RepID=A0A930UWM7_9ACTN|nr:MFS transporter [Nocardioides acrostichi]